MSDIDGKTYQWLNSLKLGKKISYLSDFDNGFQFGLIFDKLNLSKGKKFKNSSDMACVFHNFKNVRDLLLQNFKVDFPIANIMYKSSELLETLRQCCLQYSQERKQSTLRQAVAAFSTSKIQPQEQKLFATREKEIMNSSIKLNQTAKLPKKIQEIERQLEKYKEEKTKHELLALEERKKELEENRRGIEDHRQFQLSKIRINHQFVKDQEKRVHDICNKTEQIKRLRIEKDQQLNSFMQDKKDKHSQSLRLQEQKIIDQGMQAFLLNCVRQGIQLDHDPDKPAAKTQDNFNQVVVMERIKDNIRIHQKQKKQRIKRENKKAVDAAEAKIKSDVLWNENNMIEIYAKKMKDHLKVCEKIAQEKFSEQAEKETIKERFKVKSYIELPAPSTLDEERREDEYRQRRITYLDEKVVRLERRQTKHTIIAENILEALLHATITAEDHFQHHQAFSFFQWKKVQAEFLMHDHKQIKKKDKKVNSYSNSQQYSKQALSYINQSNQWQILDSKKNEDFAKLVQKLIDLSYPLLPCADKSDIPLYMPLKVTCLGDRLSGKSTISQRIAAKYGLVYINPYQLINQALDSIKEPIQEDPKKKKDSKKPEEDNPEKIALKQFAENYLKGLDNSKNATISQLIAIIKFKIKLAFQNKTEDKIIEQFEQAKQLESERVAKAMKQMQQNAKKGKKDSKKPGGQEGEEIPTEKKYFYTKGFIIDNIDLSLENFQEVQKQITGYVAFNQRVNKRAVELRAKFMNLLPISQIQFDKSLKQGCFDLIFELSCKRDILEARSLGRKIDPQTQIIYHPIFNPVPTDVKGLAERLVDVEKAEIQEIDRTQLKEFCESFGNQKHQIKALSVLSNQGTVQEILLEVSKFIEQNLDGKYQDILQAKAKAINSEQKPNETNNSEQKPNESNNSLEIKVSEEHANNGKLQIIQLYSLLQTIGGKKCEALVQQFNTLYDIYVQRIAESLHSYDACRNQFQRQYLNLQEKFVSIINRPDDKAGKILSFQENYNKLLSEKTSVVKDTEASKHLISKLDQLYDTLWIALETKKNEAVNERRILLESDWLNNQMLKIINSSKKMFEVELNFLIETIFYILKTNISFQQKQCDFADQWILLGVSDKVSTEVFNRNNLSSDLLNNYIRSLTDILDNLPQWISKKIKKLQINLEPFATELIQKTISVGSENILQKVRNIEKKASQYYLEYYCFYQILLNKMDDWIIMGIKNQNQFIYDIYKQIKKNIQEIKKSTIKDLFAKQISEILKPISRLPKSHFPMIKQSKKHLKIVSLVIFIQEIKCLSINGRIPFVLFKSYFQKRKKSSLLNPQLLRLEFDIMQQYLVTDEFCNLKQIAFAMIFWNINVFDEETITEYERQLVHAQNNSIEAEEKSENSSKQVNSSSEGRTSVTLQDLKIIEIDFSSEEIKILKHLIFDLFKDEYSDSMAIRQYLDTLRLFNQLQVLRYGDSIMMLHETAHHLHH